MTSPPSSDGHEWESARDVINRMKDGRSYILIGNHWDNRVRLMNTALSELRNDRALLKQALAEAAVPLEVLNSLETFGWRHPRLDRQWRRMVTPELRGQIKQAVTAIRETVRDVR